MGICHTSVAVSYTHLNTFIAEIAGHIALTIIKLVIAIHFKRNIGILCEQIILFSFIVGMNVENNLITYNFFSKINRDNVWTVSYTHLSIFLYRFPVKLAGILDSPV